MANEVADVARASTPRGNRAAPVVLPRAAVRMRRHKFAVIATTEPPGAPHAVRVGVATTDALQLVFDTLASTRKHANLQREPRVAVTFTGPNQRTLEYEGVAFPLSVSDAADDAYREVYYSVWPDGRERARLPFAAGGCRIYFDHYDANPPIAARTAAGLSVSGP
jgi:general stress protein 26